MSREIRWDGHGWIRKEPQVECPMDDCIPLFSVDSSSFGDTINSISMPFRGWELLAEHILSERDRRKEEAAKQPKRWLVDVIAEKAIVQQDNSRGRAQTALYFRANRDEAERLYVWAKDEKEAIQKAKEANHSLGVWIREYLA